MVAPTAEYYRFGSNPIMTIQTKLSKIWGSQIQRILLQYFIEGVELLNGYHICGNVTLCLPFRKNRIPWFYHPCQYKNYHYYQNVYFFFFTREDPGSGPLRWHSQSSQSFIFLRNWEYSMLYQSLDPKEQMHWNCRKLK